MMVALATTTAGDGGAVVATFDVPVSTRGEHTVTVSDSMGNSETATFTIVTDVSLNLTTGNIGTEVTISGTGFSGAVTIKYDEIAVATATADASGAFSATFTVPTSTGGEHTVTASDSTNVLQTTFTMESEAPSTVVLLLPEADSKEKAGVYFDWKDVTDPSGVTYTLQIATDENFTEGSILLEKEGLTESEYTIPEGEELQPTKKEAPCYWRVKAIDGASNESEWSAAGSFYISFAFALPDWAKYTLIGLGVVLVGFLGFWMGRRTAYSSF